ncbi:hypothetical protein HID58_059147 [Brassica napus]|uniref:Uncharacterized protein n=1 Tax=Brassica napus TaxID=3708 RepID=A0ABQ7ZS22_BRANA|nr:hypothetical protein HID58_059147 [Brassica napus]
MEQIRGAYPNYTEDQLSALKENEFVNWLKFYVSANEVFSDSESENGEFNEHSGSSATNSSNLD